jgi:hypothetical protein
MVLLALQLAFSASLLLPVREALHIPGAGRPAAAAAGLQGESGRQGGGNRWQRAAGRMHLLVAH